MSVTVQPIVVETGSKDHDGVLLLSDGKLAMVLVRLEDEIHEPGLRGSWFVEAAFGPWANEPGRIFPDLDQAQSWLRGEIAVLRRQARHKVNDRGRLAREE